MIICDYFLSEDIDKCGFEPGVCFDLEHFTLSCFAFFLSFRRRPPPSERVQALRYLQLTRQLMSCSADGGMAVWNMDTQREEVSILMLPVITCDNR